jgi:AraC-like DNA-binding protein
MTLPADALFIPRSLAHASSSATISTELCGRTRSRSLQSRGRSRACRPAQGLLDAEPPDAEGGITRGVREIVVILLGTGSCSIDRVAQHMGIDRRTIHRRLANEGETFSGIVDAMRRELAERYLKDGRKLIEVASLLGFSTPSGFSHWYRRHHQERPSQRRSSIKAPLR